ncbi:Metallo-dependent hydrolase [Choiromyces venosus 120613-1]|uniref:Metallo-dependent hydrolase n=1 Tax=Choiromyces venosus 120613-1 TaxID=1336337 RepID=A0A3N4JD40_9PEZI|nr:Metallo-dependent hydrolase [Choiromyces venosus 120613-1]
MRSPSSIAYSLRKTKFLPVSLKRQVHIRKIMSAPGHQDIQQQQQSSGKKKKSNNLSREGHVIPWDDLKSNYVDTHCHLFTTLAALKKDGDQSIPDNRIDLFVKQFFPKNCTSVVDIHCDLPLRDFHEQAVGLTEWPEGFKYHFSIGAHPHVAQDYTDDIHETFVKTMSNPNCVAWGECGLDYFKNSPETHPIQREVFARQLTAAVSLDKPIVIHTRDAPDDTLSLIRQHVPKSHNLHIHCFTSTAELARAILVEYPNSFIGITGVVTYNGLEHVHELIISGELPLERILLETDSPYMVPRNAYDWLVKSRPEEKKRRFAISHAGMIPFVAEKVAGWVNEGRIARGEEEIGIEEVLDITRRNAGRMYRMEV